MQRLERVVEWLLIGGVCLFFVTPILWYVALTIIEVLKRL